MKSVIFKQFGEYCVTNSANYLARISNESKILKLRNFSSAQEVIKYLVQYCGYNASEFIIINE